MYHREVHAFPYRRGAHGSGIKCLSCKKIAIKKKRLPHCESFRDYLFRTIIERKGDKTYGNVDFSS